MIKINMLLIINLILLYSCGAQDVKILMSNNKSVKVYSVIHKDTIQILPKKNNLYSINPTQRKCIIIKYGINEYQLNNLDDDVKSIVIDYNDKATKKCYLVNNIKTDAIQTYYSKYIQNYGFNQCKHLTTINVYSNEYNESDDKRILIKK